MPFCYFHLGVIFQVFIGVLFHFMYFVINFSLCLSKSPYCLARRLLFSIIIKVVPMK